LSESASNLALALRTDQATSLVQPAFDFGPAYAPPAVPAPGPGVAKKKKSPRVELKAVPSPAPEPEPAPAPPIIVRDDSRLLVFDVETTGTDKRRDQVIELCMQFGLEGASRTWRFRPSVPISPGAQAVHGISIEDLADCPTFAECAEEIAALFVEADVIVGYNLSFDIDMLQAEYERMRVSAAERGSLPVAQMDVRGKIIVDPYRLWQQCEPRSLKHAHQRFVGADFEAAHSASADVAATGRVLAGMLKVFGLDNHDWRGVAGVCDPQRPSWVGPTRHLQWDGPSIVITFGKHAGAQVHELAKGEFRDYLRWVCDRDFPLHVREVCKQALDLPAEEFLGWVKGEYGQACG
jgi:DNA polymerase-3 subunit epsilon